MNSLFCGFFLLALFLFLFGAVLKMLFDENLVELLLAVLAENGDNFFVLYIELSLLFQSVFCFLLIFLLLLLLHGLDRRPKVLRSGLPILSSLVFVKTFAPSRPHLLLLFNFGLLHDDCLLFGHQALGLRVKLFSLRHEH